MVQKAWRTRFMAGWDACISGRTENPYKRADYRSTWARGFARCAAGQALPLWYPAWLAGRASKLVKSTDVSSEDLTEDNVETRAGR